MILLPGLEESPISLLQIPLHPRERTMSRYKEIFSTV
jgi:hypothetical protein